MGAKGAALRWAGWGFDGVGRFCPWVGVGSSGCMVDPFAVALRGGSGRVFPGWQRAVRIRLWWYSELSSWGALRIEPARRSELGDPVASDAYLPFGGMDLAVVGLA